MLSAGWSKSRVRNEIGADWDRLYGRALAVRQKILIAYRKIPTNVFRKSYGNSSVFLIPPSVCADELFLPRHESPYFSSLNNPISCINFRVREPGE